MKNCLSGQKYIKLLDPNLLACPEHMDLLGQLADSGAWVDFTQGLDIRLTNARNVELIQREIGRASCRERVFGLV